MALCEMRFFGESIGKDAGMCVMLPDGRGPFPVLYLLHGFGDDHSTWQRRTSIERYVEGKGLIVVMPDGHRSFYCNDPRPGGCAYEDHIVKDVVGFVDRTFKTVPLRRARAIAGLSMGGFGSIMLAMRHPELFAAASSQSGCPGFTHSERKNRSDIQDIAGVLPRGKYDCYRLARRYRAAGHKLALRLDCGTEDFLLEDNRKFVEHLKGLEFKHEYHEYPGAHNWAFWDEHIRDTLEFVGRALRV